MLLKLLYFILLTINMATTRVTTATITLIIKINSDFGSKSKSCSIQTREVITPAEDGLGRPIKYLLTVSLI